MAGTGTASSQGLFQPWGAMGRAVHPSLEFLSFPPAWRGHTAPAAPATSHGTCRAPSVCCECSPGGAVLAAGISLKSLPRHRWMFHSSSQRPPPVTGCASRALPGSAQPTVRAAPAWLQSLPGQGAQALPFGTGIGPMPTPGSAPPELAHLGVGGPAGPQLPSTPRADPSKAEMEFVLLDMSYSGDEGSHGSSDPTEEPAADGGFPHTVSPKKTHFLSKGGGPFLHHPLHSPAFLQPSPGRSGTVTLLA